QLDEITAALPFDARLCQREAAGGSACLCLFDRLAVWSRGPMAQCVDVFLAVKLVAIPPELAAGWRNLQRWAVALAKPIGLARRLGVADSRVRQCLVCRDGFHAGLRGWGLGCRSHLAPLSLIARHTRSVHGNIYGFWPAVARGYRKT